jgi:hypothetical protein
MFQFINKLLNKAEYKFYLFTTYYLTTSEERNREYSFCITKNKQASFDKIYLFVEEKDFAFASNFNVEVVVTASRPTFQDYFNFIKSGDFDNSVNIIANTDIFFCSLDQVKKNIGRLIKGEICFALSRYDYFHKWKTKHFDRSDSQDTWIFRGHSGLERLSSVNFSMGIPGCDNRLAYELNMAGFNVLNPSKTIKTYHLHRVPFRSYEKRPNEIVLPPYLLIPPTI